MLRYLKKQFTIAIAFILIIAVIGFGIYLLVKSPKGTCYDGIQNQGEQGLDCGGPCGPCSKPENVEIAWQNFIPTTEDNFDLVAKVRNPNGEWGAESVLYRFDLYDKNNELIGSREGKTYFLPQETQYIIEPRFYSTTSPAKIEIKLRDISWQRLKDFEDLDLRIRDKYHQLVDGKFNQVSGVVENKSSYDLNKIEVIALLFNEDNKIIAVGKTEMRTVLVAEIRHFEINWPYEIADEVVSYELKPYTNIFLDENFMKKHGTPKKLKEY